MKKRWKRYAIELADAISKTKKINCTSKIHQWAKSLELLHRMDGVPILRIKDALRWYCQQLPIQKGNRFFLDIQSGASFREKFTKLEAAIARAAQGDWGENGDGDPSMADSNEGDIVVRSREVKMTDEEFQRHMDEM